MANTLETSKSVNQSWCKSFYTYLHCKPDGTPFYVGKGSKKRAFSFYDRSKYHKRVVEKYGKDNIQVFVFECVNEAQAFADEISHIKQLRFEGFILVNHTAGGEGISGFSHSEETKLKLAAKALGRVHSTERRLAQSLRMKGSESPNKGHRHSPETRARISLSMSGLRKTEEQSAAQSKRQIGVPHPRGKGVCFACGRELDLCHLKRYHLGKCKILSSTPTSTVSQMEPLSM